MNEYKMKDRRPIKEVFRKMGYGFVDILVERNVSPNTISYISVVLAGLGGLLLYLSTHVHWLLLLAPLCFFFRLYCNMIDGMVAVKADKCSAWGEVLNELPDRISDTIIFVGLGLSGLADMMLSFWVIVGMLFGTYVGVLGKAIGVHRQFGGWMHKQNRMFALAAGCWATWALDLFFVWPFELSLLDWFNIAILIGLVQTTLTRIWGIYVEIGGRV